MADIFPIYEKLWARAESDGATVLYLGLGDDGGGVFYPHYNDSVEPRPTIEIIRNYYETIDSPTRDRNEAGRRTLPPPDLLREVVTLAHEFGHFLSWKGRTPRETWDRYYEAIGIRDETWAQVDESGSIDAYNDRRRAAVQDALTEDQLQLIIDEETRAWIFGREALLDLRFSDLEYYDDRSRKGVYYHRYRLGLVPLLDEDNLPNG